jgi:hypothetical protein
MWRAYGEGDGVNKDELRKISPEGRAAYYLGYKAALTAFAWWRDGTQYVGCGRKTLKEELEWAQKVYYDVGFEEKEGREIKP